MSAGEFNEEVICCRMRGAADRGARGRVRYDASAAGGPFARSFGRFAAIGVWAGIARSGSRRAGRHHAATGRPGSRRVQGRVCHVYLDP